MVTKRWCNFSKMVALLNRKEVIKRQDLMTLPKNDWTALMWASYGGNKDVVLLLFTKGADVNAKINNGVTALTWASQKGHQEIVQLLLAKGADVIQRGMMAGSHCWLPSIYGHKEVVQLFKNAGAVDYRSKEAIK
jgi:ankyrin repeat protein